MNIDSDSGSQESTNGLKFGIVNHMEGDQMSQMTHLTEASRAFFNDNDYDTDSSSSLSDDEDDTETAVPSFKPDQIIRLGKEENARESLKYYKGIENLRNYEWDLNEYLPLEYSQLNKFSNYVHQRKVILESCDNKNTVILIS